MGAMLFALLQPALHCCCARVTGARLASKGWITQGRPIVSPHPFRRECLLDIRGGGLRREMLLRRSTAGRGLKAMPVHPRKALLSSIHSQQGMVQSMWHQMQQSTSLHWLMRMADAAKAAEAQASGTRMTLLSACIQKGSGGILGPSARDAHAILACATPEPTSIICSMSTKCLQRCGETLHTCFEVQVGSCKSGSPPRQHNGLTGCLYVWQVLLEVHNSRNYLDFFADARRAISASRFADFRQAYLNRRSLRYSHAA